MGWRTLDKAKKWLTEIKDEVLPCEIKKALINIETLWLHRLGIKLILKKHVLSDYECQRIETGLANTEIRREVINLIYYAKGDYAKLQKLWKAEKEKFPPDELPIECFKGTISKDEGHSCEVIVESIFGIIDRLRKKRRKEAKEVWIVVEPAPEYKDEYQRTAYKRKFSAGHEFPLKVTLKPKKNT